MTQDKKSTFVSYEIRQCFDVFDSNGRLISTRLTKAEADKHIQFLRERTRIQEETGFDINFAHVVLDNAEPLQKVLSSILEDRQHVQVQPSIDDPYDYPSDTASLRSYKAGFQDAERMLKGTSDEAAGLGLPPLPAAAGIAGAVKGRTVLDVIEKHERQMGANAVAEDVNAAGLASDPTQGSVCPGCGSLIGTPHSIDCPTRDRT